METITSSFPNQKVSDNKKTQEWHKQCMLNILNTNYYPNSKIRTSRYNKITNYRLFDGVVDDKDIEKAFNPMGLNTASIPAKMQNFPVELPKFNRLIGEEGLRKLDWRLRILNEDAISELEETKKEQVNELLIKEVQNPKYTEEQAKKRLEQIQKYFKYDYRDAREKMGTELLTYLYRTQNFNEIFNSAFKDVLIVAEEIYSCDIINGEPTLKKCNPANIYALRGGDSHRIEDFDTIIEDGYKGVGQITDDYYEFLTSADIDKITKHDYARTGGIVQYGYNPGMPNSPNINTSELIFIEDNPNNITSYNDAFYDVEGNIRVTRVCWKSFRKLGQLKYYDEEGQVQYDFIDENYPIDETKGEEVVWYWVNEWREGTRIGKDIFVKMQPYPVNVYELDTLTLKTSPYIGTIYNTNIGRGISLMDRIKPYKYQYNIYSRRLELAFAKWKGPLMEMDIAKKPEHWDIEKWITYAEMHGYLIVDSFSTVNEGAAMGKLAGNFNTTGKVLNPDIGNYIQHMINVLEMIKRNISEISGVAREREGQGTTADTLGGQQQNIQQSAYITEEWYMIHDNTKLRVLTQMLEVAKIAYKGKKKKLQYTVSDLSRIILNLDGDALWEASLGIVASNSAEDKMLMQMMRQLADRALASDKMSASQIMKLYMDNSIASVRREIEADEQEVAEKEQANIEAQQNMQKELAQLELEQKELDRQLRQYEIDQNNITKIRVAEINSFSRVQDQDMDKNQIPDQLEVGSLAIKEYDVRSKEQLAQRKLELDERIAKLKAETERYKADMALKVAKENKTNKELVRKK